jgi:phosphoribosyl 1,2-cyclic phosphodiesterase
VHIELESGNDLILDAGTGIRLLGNKLANKSAPANVLLSHGHWDHIQGYPFFAPIYQPDRDIHVYISVEKGRKLLSSLFQQMDGTHFPVKAEDLPSNNFPKFKGIESELYEREGIKVVRQAINHPGGGSAYKINENGMTCAYVTDNELDPPYAASTNYDQWVNYLHGVDVLIHDAQYTEDDMPHKHGWGIRYCRRCVNWRPMPRLAPWSCFITIPIVATRSSMKFRSRIRTTSNPIARRHAACAPRRACEFT